MESKFSKDGPEWNECVDGANLEGTCENFDCEAFGWEVNFPLGFGTFNIALESDRAICSECKTNLKNPYNIVYSHCKYIENGRKFSGERRNKEGLAVSKYVTYRNKTSGDL